MNHKRTIIGSEINDDRHLELEKRGTQISVPVTLFDGNGDVISTLPGSANSTIGDGTKSVTTAGTREQLSGSSVPCKKLTIQAKIGNTGSVYVGGSTVASTRGIELLPTGTIQLTVSNLNLVYIDVSVNGEGVTYIYEN